jgi:hypothetical protein
MGVMREAYVSQNEIFPHVSLSGILRYRYGLDLAIGTHITVRPQSERTRQNLLAGAASDFTNQQGPIPLSTVPEPASRASQSGLAAFGVACRRKAAYRLYGNAWTTVIFSS